MRLQFVFFFFFCLPAFGQNPAVVKRISLVENALYSGDLDQAKTIVQSMARSKIPTDKQYAYLYAAKIAFFQGDLKGMNSFLPRITDRSPEIVYYKNLLYGHYLILNNQTALGYQSLERAMEEVDVLNNPRIYFSNQFISLQLISFQENRLSSQAGEILDELRSREKDMGLFEKSQLYTLESNFCSVKDTAQQVQLGEKIRAFGQQNDFAASRLLGHLILSKFSKTDAAKLAQLDLAFVETKKSKIIQLNSDVYFSYMDFYEAKNELDSAIFWAQKAMFPAFLDLNVGRDPYARISEMYEKKGNIERALFYKKMGAEKFQEVSQRHAINIREYLIGGLEQNIQEKNDLLDRNKILILGISVFAGILLVLLYFMLRLDRRLRKALVKVQQANSEMEMFSRIVSHDLKAPIFTISKLVGYVLEDEKNLNFQSQSYLNAALDTCENSNLLINNIMTFLRFQEKSVAFSTVSVKKIMGAVTTNLQEQIKMNNAEIELSNFPATLLVNDVLFIQLFQNLLQNSIKYRQIDVDPVIQIDYWPLPEGYAISFRDNGKGIPPGKSETMLKAFEQDLSASINEGIGLGLAICSAIVKLHQGTIALRNNNVAGIEVYMTFKSVN
ncbi:MAG: ATP-binding protein [Crocinitomicaceae bacterium]